MTPPSRSYAFPARNELSGGPERSAEQDPAAAAALARGYQEGLRLGQQAALAELTQAAAVAHAQALEEGRRAGLAELESAAGALRAALAECADARAATLVEAESFAVELALAAAARLVEIDEVRADFVKRAIRAGIQTLAPQRPLEVVLNPADVAAAEAALEGLTLRTDAAIAAGGVRVDAGRLLVENTLADALEQIRLAVFATRARRTRARRT
ncbi:MAG TPA: FliH/SctL family protein [Candidatus Binataceae bacterium]|nr:FliH/SctL family protein [Candidatus Binataceae bacterium]